MDTSYVVPGEWETGLQDVRQSPREKGRLILLVRRPAKGAREELSEAIIDEKRGLVGDSWEFRQCSSTPDGSPDPRAQVTLINTRLIAMIAGARDRWALSGDQFYVDFDLSCRNLPDGSRVQIGTVLLELTGYPHTGCESFIEWYGAEAMKLVNSPLGMSLRLRGANARVVKGGTVRIGDPVKPLRQG
jgi:hypothetical protein